MSRCSRTLRHPTFQPLKPQTSNFKSPRDVQGVTPRAWCRSRHRRLHHPVCSPSTYQRGALRLQDRNFPHSPARRRRDNPQSCTLKPEAFNPQPSPFLVYCSRAWSCVIQKPMSLDYEPSSEPLHISAKTESFGVEVDLNQPSTLKPMMPKTGAAAHDRADGACHDERSGRGTSLSNSLSLYLSLSLASSLSPSLTRSLSHTHSWVP